MAKGFTHQCTSSPRRKQRKGRDNHDHLHNCVWLVRSENRTASHTLPHQLHPSGSSSGTAFMLRFLERSWLLTCHHVVSSALHIWVSLSRQGLSNAQPARLVAACPLLDLALLEFLDPTYVDEAAYLSPWTAQVGENTLAGPKAGAASLAVGFPLGQTHLKITRGIINGQQNGFLQTDAPINPGNSGGPLMCQHKVVGISAQGAFMASSVGWAIPINYALNFLRHIAEQTTNGGTGDMDDDNKLNNLDEVYNVKPVRMVHFPRSWGMEYSHRADFLLLPEPARSTCGVRVHHIHPCGFAMQARLCPNDIILKMDGRYIDGAGNLDLLWLQEPVSLQIFLYHQRLGSTLEIEILRDNKVLSMRVILEVEPSSVAYSLCLWPVHCPTPHFYLAGLVFMNLTPQLLVMLQSSIAMDIHDFELNGGGSFESPMQESSVSILDPALLRPMRPKYWTTSFVVVAHVLAGSLIQQHTIFKIGDIVKTCDQQPIRTVDHLREVVRTKQAQRNGQEEQLLHLAMESGRETWLHMHTVMDEERKLQRLHGYSPPSGLEIDANSDHEQTHILLPNRLSGNLAEEEKTELETSKPKSLHHEDLHTLFGLLSSLSSSTPARSYSPFTIWSSHVRPHAGPLWLV